ncbi:MAG: DnaJ domain-containing protein [Leptolyngbyaceae cyanobacterium]
MIHNLYQTLELPEDASQKEIKKAYCRLVRKHPPEKEPDRFQEIRKAYETLRDPKARQAYDDLQRHGAEVNRLLAQAEYCSQAKQWTQAIRLLKQTVVLVPGNEAIRNRLGICYIYSQNWEQAINVFERLVKSDPEVPIYWQNFGAAYDQWALSLRGSDEKQRSQLYKNAREKYEQSIALESFNAAPYLSISQTYLDENCYDLATTWAEKAIEADDKVDFSDFDAFFLLSIIHLRAGNLKEIEKISQRMQSISSLGEEAKKYAASRFLAVGNELIKAGMVRKQVEYIEAALSFIKLARRFDPYDKEIQKLNWHINERLRNLKRFPRAETSRHRTVANGSQTQRGTSQSGISLFRAIHLGVGTVLAILLYGIPTLVFLIIVAYAAISQAPATTLLVVGIVGVLCWALCSKKKSNR